LQSASLNTAELSRSSVLA